MNTDGKPSYHAFLLRCWREEGNEWRFRLQELQTGEQTGFTDLDALLDFLRARIEENSKPNF